MMIRILYCRLLTVTLFLIPTSVLFGQNSRKADSLRNILGSQELTDSIKSRILYGLMVHEGKPDQALLYAQSYIKLAQQRSDRKRQARGWEELSLIHRRLGDIPASTKAALKAQSIFRDAGLTKELAASHAQLASNLMLEERYVESITEYKQALQVYEEVKDTIRTCLTLLNIGEAFRLDEESDSAVVYFQKALSLNVSNHKIVYGYATGNLGLVYLKLGKFGEARRLLDQAIELLDDLGDLYSVSVYTFELGQSLAENGDPSSGERKMLNAYEIVRTEGLKEQLRDFSLSLSRYYQAAGAFEKALLYQQEYQVYKDSLINISNVRQVEQLKAKSEVDKRESEISFLNEVSSNQKRMVLGLSLGSLVLALLLGLLYRNNQQKKRINRALTQREKEKALLLQELNHRTKNNLQMISSLLNLQSMSLQDHPAAAAVREGRHRVDSLVLIHKKLYQEDYSHLDMQLYLKELTDHLRISFNPEIQVALEVFQGMMSVDQAIPVALIVNELLTNALKYGGNGQDSVHQVNIDLLHNKDEYSLEIKDNGPGMAQPDVNTLQSFGLVLVYSLVEQLQGKIEFDGSRGVRWTICFAHR